jgi:hypothetical protein
VLSLAVSLRGIHRLRSHFEDSSRHWDGIEVGGRHDHHPKVHHGGPAEEELAMVGEGTLLPSSAARLPGIEEVIEVVLTDS